jgi:hypothetical protein
MSIALWLASCAAAVPPAQGEEPRGRLKPKIEFRWLESTHIQGVTEDWGVQMTCAPERSYPHKTAVLTAKDVAEARLCQADFSSSGLPSELYMVSFRLTEQAKKKLVEECGDATERMLVVLVNNQSWGVRFFRKAEAANFEPQAGFTSSKSEAKRLIDACK